MSIRSKVLSLNPYNQRAVSSVIEMSCAILSSGPYCSRSLPDLPDNQWCTKSPLLSCCSYEVWDSNFKCFPHITCFKIMLSNLFWWSNIVPALLRALRTLQHPRDESLTSYLYCQEWIFLQPFRSPGAWLSKRQYKILSRPDCYSCLRSNCKFDIRGGLQWELSFTGKYWNKVQLASLQ